MLVYYSYGRIQAGIALAHDIRMYIITMVILRSGIASVHVVRECIITMTVYRSVSLMRMLRIMNFTQH